MRVEIYFEVQNAKNQIITVQVFKVSGCNYKITLDEGLTPGNPRNYHTPSFPSTRQNRLDFSYISPYSTVLAATITEDESLISKANGCSRPLGTPRPRRPPRLCRNPHREKTGNRSTLLPNPNLTKEVWSTSFS